MDERTGLSDQYRRASPWPLFIALGLPIAELGILFNSFPVTVGGTLLLFGSVAGILNESGYVDEPWLVLGGLGALTVLVGAAVVLTQTGSIATRGEAIAIAGGVSLVGAVVVRLQVGTV